MIKLMKKMLEKLNLEVEMRKNSKTRKSDINHILDKKYL